MGLRRLVSNFDVLIILKNDDLGKVVRGVPVARGSDKIRAHSDRVSPNPCPSSFLTELPRFENSRNVAK
jgi:hypothetical protein